MPMDFQKAKNYVIRFGEYSGQSIDEIAESNEGLRYLDDLLNWNGLWKITRAAIECYLEDPSIAGELEGAIDAG